MGLLSEKCGEVIAYLSKEKTLGFLFFILFTNGLWKVIDLLRSVFQLLWALLMINLVTNIKCYFSCYVTNTGCIHVTCIKAMMTSSIHYMVRQNVNKSER